MDLPPFVDANIFVRHVAGDEPTQSSLATAFFARFERGEPFVRTADTVIFETVYVLERFYHVSREDIRDALMPLLALPGIRLPGKSSFRGVFALYVARRSLSFADCYHAVLMRRLDLSEIISFDQGFDRLPGINRREPS